MFTERFRYGSKRVYAVAGTVQTGNGGKTKKSGRGSAMGCGVEINHTDGLEFGAESTLNQVLVPIAGSPTAGARQRTETS